MRFHGSLSALATSALVAASAALLAGCSSDGPARTTEAPREAAPSADYQNGRDATGLCRREVDRLHGTKFRVAFDRATVTDTSASTQLVVLPFTLSPADNSTWEPQRRAFRCTLSNGILTGVTETGRS